MDVPPLIRAMLRPTFYSHRPARVELIQTHISYIFLVGRLVFKVKKPVDFGFLNFTTLRRRAYYCRREVILNRRLAPDLYLGVVPIRESDGEYFLDGPGPIVEYAVSMKRLPDRTLLSRRLVAGRVGPKMMRDLAGLLAAFHRRAVAGRAVDRFGSPAMLAKNIEENFAQEERYCGRTISPADFELITEYSHRFLREKRGLLRRRVTGGCIREGHGDLHAEHVGWDHGRPFVFDCIEFNRRFRCADVAAEIAFLAMDLEYRGAWLLAREFILAYLEETGDWEILALLDFYLCYRAYVRGKVNSFVLDEPEQSRESARKAERSARRYFKQAAGYAGRDARPILLATTGLIGSGKSTLADLLSRRLNYRVLRSDIIRKKMAGIQPDERSYDGYRRGLYSREMTEATYRALMDEGRRRLAEGQSVVLDASFSRRDHRLEALRLSRSCGASFHLMETCCTGELIKNRLADRSARGRTPSDGRWEIYLRQKKDYQTTKGFPAGEACRIDTSGTMEEIYNQALRALYPLEHLPPGQF